MPYGGYVNVLNNNFNIQANAGKKVQQDIILPSPQLCYIKHAYIGQIYDPKYKFAKKAKYYLLNVYVENDDKIQTFFLKFSNSIDKFSMVKLTDLDVWHSNQVTKYQGENTNQIY